ncbi:Uu.00g103270.m01.CDS01 [Anthostomella pinea]|uniref:Uu.00g103270.m01.CDS01 n=1 Tax=Anthostomella pinea TaxID=933095 RepID=A0AAI8VE80_9PEZI|nr:Uu.00g103270.m01.CDS01 [Anthostomella pinea]
MPKQAIVNIQEDVQSVDIIDTPIPTPKDKEIVIRVVVAGSNPKDWKMPLWHNFPHNSGDDMAGVVYSVGKDVYEFKPGDRVAAFHEVSLQGGFTENGAFAEYAVAPDWTTFHVPHNISFEEAATMPVAALTAAIALFCDMKLPAPHAMPAQAERKTPLLIYGVSSAVGAFAAKLARLSGIGPIIGVAGRAGDFARTLVDHVVDYRQGEDAVVAAVEAILEKEGLGSKVPYVLDAISEHGSLETTLRFIDPNGGTVSTVLPPNLFAKDKENFAYPAGVTAINSAVPLVHATHKDFGYIWSRYLGRLLEDGRLKPHPYEVIPGGLNGVLTGLKKLKNGEASAVKYVFRIEETDDGYVSQNSGKPVPAAAHENTHPLRNFPFPA